ncbi:hypothetical protein [Thaumasiovibrio sp. DFM-14]|uniref:hypothetical protein n=1 Tax=Thaumasiovibrio sp. DFM-14 TaxID=3384792 RepID=UPI0039A1A603
MEVNQLECTTKQIEIAVDKANNNLMLKPAVPVLRLVLSWMKGVNRKVSDLEKQQKELMHE